MMTALLIVAGLFLLYIGGEGLVRGSVSIARRFGLSELIIGLTLIGFGTSLPELVTSLRALSTDAVGLSVGNVIGSNIANVLLVLGAAAVVAPIITSPKSLARDATCMVLATIALMLVLWLDMFTRTVGIAMFSMLLVYLVGSIILDHRQNGAAGDLHGDEASLVEGGDPLWLAVALTVVGICGVVLGARFLVDGGTIAARSLGVSETVIGISVLAIGTSLPELVTSLVAARKGKADVALGNVLGSNIFNILSILGLSAIIYPFSVMVEVAGRSEPVSLVAAMDIVVLAASVLLLGFFAFVRKRIGRLEGLVFLIGYGLYVALRYGLLSGLGVA